MKKHFCCILILVLIISCSKTTYIAEDFYYTVDDKKSPNKNNKIINVNSIDRQTEKKETQSGTKKVDAVIEFGKKFIGVPYKWGGNTPQGFDCSGFINYIFNNNGYNLHGNAPVIATLCDKIEKKNLKKGDLVFFKGSNINDQSIGHVALVISVNGDDFEMIHATTSKGVMINSFLQYDYWKTRFLFAGRIKGNYIN